MPLSQKTIGLNGGAAADLGLGDMLGAQVKDETDEERKRKMRQQRQMANYGSAAASLGLLGDGASGI